MGYNNLKVYLLQSLPLDPLIEGLIFAKNSYPCPCLCISMGHDPIRVCLLQHEKDNISHRARKRKVATVRALLCPRDPLGQECCGPISAPVQVGQTTGGCWLLGRCHCCYKAEGEQTSYCSGA